MSIYAKLFEGIGSDLRVILGRVFSFRMNWNFPPLFRVNEIGTTLGLGCFRDDAFKKKDVEGEMGLIVGYNLGALDVGGPRMWVFQPKHRNFHYSSVSSVSIRDLKEKSIYMSIEPRNVIVTDCIDLYDTLPTFKCWVDFSVRRHEGYMTDKIFSIMAIRRWSNITGDIHGFYSGKTKLVGEPSDIEAFEALCPHLPDGRIYDRLNGRDIAYNQLKHKIKNYEEHGEAKSYDWSALKKNGLCIPEHTCNCTEKTEERFSLGYGAGSVEIVD